VSQAGRDRLLAAVMLAFAAAVVLQARAIEDSLLADSVGAGGVPQGVGVALGLAALALLAKSWFGPGNAGAAAPSAAGSNATGERAGAWRTAGLVVVLLVHALALPWLGYGVTVVALLLACGWLAGAPLKLPLLLTALLGGPLLWVLFDRLLRVRMPIGMLWGG